MINQSSREVFYFRIPIVIADLIIHVTILFALMKMLPTNTVNEVLAYSVRVGTILMLALSFFVSLQICPIRLYERNFRVPLILRRAVCQTVTTYFLFTVFLALVYKVMPRHLIFDGFIISLVVISVWHCVANRMIKCLRKLGHNTRHVVIIGADANAKYLYEELLNGQVMTGYIVEGFFTSLSDYHLPDGAKYLGHVNQFFDWVKENHPDEIYCSIPPATDSEIVNRIITICNEQFIDFVYVPTMDGYPHRKMTISNIGRVNIIKLREEPLNSPFAKLIKRIADIIFSLIFLVTIYPFVLLFVFLGNVLMGNRGPLYFRQERTGYNGNDFKIYKFRSMKANADADILQATENDPRKTRFGDFLRRSSIDELPQFINVLRGEMSIIGPRPHMKHHTDIYSSLIKDYMVRHLAKPGITGWAQVNGCRGETKTTEEMAKRVEHDIWYIEHWSPWLDADIVFRTIWQLFPGHDKQAY